MTIKSNSLIVSLIVFAGLVAAGISAYSQPAVKYIRDGNSNYEDSKFKEAEINYRKALEKSPNSLKGTYNLGNSQYKQQNFKEASQSYEKLAGDPKNKNLSQLYHNLGNAYLQSDKYRESVEAYKQALRINPKDEDTRYNLAYALTKLQQQQNQNQQNKQQQKQNQQQQQQQEQNQKQDQQKQNQKMSKQDADRMLNALRNNEKRTMDKVKKQLEKPGTAQPEKDW